VRTKRTLRAASAVAATGWEPYDARRIENLGFGKYPNVVTNLMLERMAARDGPTGGKILRPSDGKEPRSVAFVQCAGSRDENHLPYCSGVCCSASLKQVTYLRALYPDITITVHYIDLRTPGLMEDFLAGVSAQPGVQLVKGKVARVEQDESGNLCITAEDVLRGTKATRQVELLVLATGLVPRTGSLPRGFVLDEFGFVGNGACKPGFAAAGCVRRPGDVAECVRDATGAALKAFQWAVRSARHAEEAHA
jgi:quinone-modifying oxidoreductase subunit QmoA